MYQPAAFVETHLDALQALVRAHPLALLLTQDSSGALQANPLPMLLEAGATAAGTLRGHVAKANSVWRETREDVLAVAVFQGEQRYVSPGFYPSKAEHGKVVPTWNYQVVQGRGRVRFIHDREWLHALVSRLTQRFEEGRDRPWAVGDAPAEYLDAMLGAIVGVEIELDEWVGKFKLSQNRAAADRAGVVAGFEAEAAGGDEAATRMAEAVAGAGRGV